MGIRPKLLIDPQDYHDRKEGRIQVNHKNDVHRPILHNKAANMSRCHIVYAAP